MDPLDRLELEAAANLESYAIPGPVVDRLWLEAAANEEGFNEWPSEHLPKVPKTDTNPPADDWWRREPVTQRWKPKRGGVEAWYKEACESLYDWARRNHKDQRDMNDITEYKNAINVEGKRKHSWNGWGPALFPKHHKVAEWDWDNRLNGYVSKTGSPFQCECGETLPVPSFRICTCGRQWNSYGIGTGGDLHTANTEMFLCREIPLREGVLVANAKMAGDLEGWEIA